MSVPTVLEKILARKAEEVAERRARVSLAELEDRLRTEKALTPDFPVIVRGDAQVQYARVVEVLDLLRRIDLNQVGLVTGKPQG